MQPRQMQGGNRMLKTSMIVEPTSNSNKRMSNAGGFQNYPIIPNIKTFPTFLSNQPIQHHNVYSQQQRQPQFQTQHNKDQGNHIQRPNDPVFNQIYSELQRLSRLVEKHQFQISSFSLQGDISKRLLNELKKNLPAITGGNDVYDHILTMRLQIKNLQQQLTRMPRINDLDTAVKKQFQVYQKNNQNSTNSSLSGSSANKSVQLDPLLGELLKKRDEYFNKVLEKIDTQISILKKNLSNFNIEMKVSPITSSSCIMLKYQQLFKARNKNENDMVLSQTTYYIDSEGFLLDCHSRYIVDQKGKKIKLEEKHLNMLKGQKILQ